MMLRLSALLAALLLTVGLASPAEAGTVTFTDAQGVGYSADDENQVDGATVTSYNGGAQSVNIPATVSIEGTDYAVKAIAGEVFAQKQLTSVTIPDSVTYIGSYAFYGSQLSSVTLGEGGVPYIGEYAFAFTLLTSATIPGGVIDNQSFGGNQLTSVTIGDGVTSIGNDAFWLNQIHQRHDRRQRHQHRYGRLLLQSPHQRHHRRQRHEHRRPSVQRQLGPDGRAVPRPGPDPVPTRIARTVFRHDERFARVDLSG